MHPVPTCSLSLLYPGFSSAGDGRFWESYQCIDQALARFREALPPIDATMFSQDSIIDNESADAYAATIPALPSNSSPPHQNWLEFTLSFAHVSAAAALIQLHGIFADRDESEASVVLAAARDVAGIVRTIGTRGGFEGGQSSVLPSFDPRRLHKLVCVSPTAKFVSGKHLTERCSIVCSLLLKCCAENISGVHFYLQVS